MRLSTLLLLLAIPFFSSAQIRDSLTTVKQIDSLLQQVRPLVEQQKLEEAMQVLDLAEERTMAAFGKSHAVYATCLIWRGKIAQRKEKFREAETWYLQAMAIQEKVYGKESPQYAISLSSLSIIYLNTGEYAEAEPLILKALAIREKLVGKQHPDYARTLGSLGTLNFHKGNYGKAEYLYLEALAVFERTLGKQHQEYAYISGNLASVYIETGNYDKAEPLLLEVKDIFAAIFGTKHPLYVRLLIELATLYSDMGEIAKSEALNLEAKDLFVNVLGKETADYASVLENLAAIYMDAGDLARAEPLLLEAEEVLAKVYGQQHKDYAWVLKEIGRLYVAKGDYVRAESYLLQAHHLNKTILAKDHPNCAITAGLLAQLYVETGHVPESGAYLLEAGAVNRKALESATGYSSQSEMQHYLATFGQYTNQFYTFAQSYPGPEIAGAAYDNALFYKGFLLNASIQVKSRANSDSLSFIKYETLRGYRHWLAEQYALPAARRDSTDIAAMEDKANGLEKELARTVVGFSDGLRQVNWREVQAALKPGEAAVEFMNFQFEDLKGKPTDSIMYVSLVLRPGDSSPKVISLFEERELTQLLKGASGGNYRKINAVYSAEQQMLNKLIWQKLEPALKGVNKVYCALTGLLYRLNVGAIPLSRSQTFADRRQLVLLGSTRQLVIRAPGNAYNKQAFLVGGVNYGENDDAIDAANKKPGRSRGLPDSEYTDFQSNSPTRSESWEFLPGSVTEVLDIGKILESEGLSVHIDSAYAATEESVKLNSDPPGQLSPRILHFATHGYFFPDPKKASSRDAIAFKSSQNPLLRSGLILAGAQEVWTSGKPPANREDGVLTALEISLLDLSGTELVVLSACETGLGDIDGNEGVYGLQRAFKIAGAKYVVMSLWKVNDQTSSEFMTDFYAQWLQKGLGIPEAFRKAQHDLRIKYPGDAYHWAGFVLVE